MTDTLSLDDLLLSLRSLSMDQGATVERNGRLDEEISRESAEVVRKIKALCRRSAPPLQRYHASSHDDGQ